jgi:hypothetical protein
MWGDEVPHHWGEVREANQCTAEGKNEWLFTSTLDVPSWCGALFFSLCMKVKRLSGPYYDITLKLHGTVWVVRNLLFVFFRKYL